MISFKESAKTKAQYDRFSQIIEKLSAPPKERFDNVRAAIRSGFAENFETESAGGIPWRQLAPSTARQRALLGYGATHPILERTGSYKDTWLSPGNADHVSVFEQSNGKTTVGDGSKDYRTPFHEQGGPVIPKRSVAVLSENAKQHVVDELKAMVEAILHGR